jgi:protein-S-isoprenylcysteine O-methyltransferase Ste14
MQLKVPPVAVLIVAMLMLFAGARLLPQLSVSFPGQMLLAIMFVFVGILPGGQAIRSFVQSKTTVNPMAPETATKLVTEGFYRFSRNPMYLGMLCLLLALSIYWGTMTAFVILPLFVWYMTEFQIKPEEESLKGVFGSSYLEYLSKVRRWF